MEGSRNPFLLFIPWIRIHSGGQPPSHRLAISYNVLTFIRFLVSNVREETWPASIVMNERNSRRWNGWSNYRDREIFETMIYRVLLRHGGLYESETFTLKRESNWGNSFRVAYPAAFVVNVFLIFHRIFVGFV